LNADRKVLLVEDEVLVSALAVDALEELGYRTVEVTTAKAARAAASGAVSFAFAIIDIGLPDGRGDALAIELRQKHASLPVIIATGYDGGQLSDSLRKDRRTAVLHKPYDIAQLKAAIESIT
jgi:DNA-binding response OmpR family regulator